MEWMIALLSAVALGIILASWIERRRFVTLVAMWEVFDQAERDGDEAMKCTVIEHFIAKGAGDPYATNVAVNALINRGRYSEALRIGARLPTSRFLLYDPNYRTRMIDLEHLVHINLAEAEYNLGRWYEALARLERVSNHDAEFSPLTQAGLACQRAWVLAHLDRNAEAESALAVARVEDLPNEYQAEWHYTHGIVALLGGRPERARAYFLDGLACALRPSSVRNGLFLCARASWALGDLDVADAQFVRAAEHPYRDQGGDGLLAWGDMRASQGRGNEAREAWELASTRDPESASASLARQRLNAAVPTMATAPALNPVDAPP